DSGDHQPPAALGHEAPGRPGRAARVIHAPAHALASDHAWRGRAGMIALIIAEGSLFAVFVVAHLFYAGKSLNGPFPRDVLAIPVIGTLCLLSSSVTVALGARALGRGDVARSGLWLLVTTGLGALFLAGTAREWYHLIHRDGLTIATNLFGT